jgi:hypothetical protein
LHKARKLPKREFKREVSKHLTGKETEPWEILYFKAQKSQLPVIEQALESVPMKRTAFFLKEEQVKKLGPVVQIAPTFSSLF